MDATKSDTIESKIGEIERSVRIELANKEYSPGVRRIPPKANGYYFAMEMCRRILKMKKEGGLDGNLGDPELLRFKTQKGTTAYAVRYGGYTIGLPREMDTIQNFYDIVEKDIR